MIHANTNKILHTADFVLKLSNLKDRIFKATWFSISIIGIHLGYSGV